MVENCYREMSKRHLTNKCRYRKERTVHKPQFLVIFSKTSKVRISYFFDSRVTGCIPEIPSMLIDVTPSLTVSSIYRKLCFHFNILVYSIILNDFTI